MKHIQLNIADGIKLLNSDVLEKDLEDNQTLCKTCGGYGVVKRKNPFGIKEKLSDEKYNAKINWYDNESITFCPDCYNGVVTLCEYCGKPIKKGYISRCDCEQYLQKEKESELNKKTEIISKATRVNISDVTSQLYCEENDKYYDPEEIESFFYDFDGEDVPKILWVTRSIEISLDAGNIIEDACQDLYDGASDSCDYNGLQKVLDEWCSKQSGTTTYYPDNKEYVLTSDLQ